MAAGFAAALGGATSNFIDRASRGFVTDYIALRAGLVINLGDAAIAAGTALALVAFFVDGFG